MDNHKEYLNPIGKLNYLSIQHLERYRFVLNRLNHCQLVLDIACGAGYGSAMLLRHGCKVIGVDYDNEAVANARIIWRHNGFIKADALELPFSDNSFDAVVSFETIEHVKDGNQFLSEMCRVLRPDGIFICSTPNIRYTAHPLYHVKEYEPEEFYKLAQQWFPHVEYYGQYFKLLDRASDLYRRHFHARLVAIIEKMGIKEFLKQKFRFDAKEDLKNTEGQPIKDLSIEQALKEGCNSYYRVRSFVGFNLLRIMVIVAKKGEPE